jgi:hypothetical protein
MALGADPSQVSLGDCTYADIMDHIMVAHRREDDSLISFQWPAAQVESLLSRISLDLEAENKPDIRAFEYDYDTGTAYAHVLHECELPYQIRSSLAEYVKILISRRCVAMDDQVGNMLGQVTEFDIRKTLKHERKLYKRLDAAFGRRSSTLPSLVFEVS